ncbi:MULTISPECIES: GAF and ANTAR domain-containing protein [unclassified Aeromicrobium]|uniref:GAF and ANTAR domain-containing protein n=1 Tax=unclassified Aeromicrobium TaxID=2633570 RepID=UPI0006F76DE3|nr:MULTISPECIES: GAF and ANTAR domain-containing protein [unclassified Aeromicrobium]KQP26003.1 hypothetical protein ASF38_10045 [Aeromicrobium sp. Leaf272]KQP79000.1 hypothetical protein ASF37_11010 [Aeromicrobium sp. Leaf289]KQP84708.1 hypothetical protein ASF35_07505 [Aeromicrobium sp. Leaf291]
MSDMARALSTVSASLVIPHDVAGTLTALLEEVTQAFGAVACSVAVADRHDRLEVLTSSSHREDLLTLHDVQAAEGPLFEAWTHGRPVTMPDISSTTHPWPDLTAAMETVGVCSALAVPLRWGGQPLGAVGLVRTVPGDFDAAQAVHLQAFADLAMLVIVHADPVSVRTAVQRIDDALTGRIAVEQAKGALAYLHDSTTADAYDLLRRRAEEAEVTLSEAAHIVLREAEQGRDDA